MQFLKNYFLVLLVSITALAFPKWELHTDFNEKEQFILREIEGVKILSALSPLAKSILQELIAEHEKVLNLFKEQFDISVLEDSYA